MITCPKCGKELVDGARFCDSCGAKIYETVFCPNCGEKTSSEFAFCQSCGAAIAETPEIPASPESSAASAEPAQEKKPIPKKAVLFGGIGVAAVAVIALIAMLLSGGGKKDNYAMYLKDKEIVYTDFSKNGPMEISSHLVNGNSSISNSDLAYSGSEIGSYIALNEKGTRIFYPDRVDTGADGITLYTRDLKKPETDPVKIDSDVTRYAIKRDGSQVVYLKGSDGGLYIHDLTDRTKISSGVSSFRVSEDFKKISYFKDGNSVYIWNAGKDSEKLAGDLTTLSYISDNLSTFYYIKDGSLYKQTEGSSDREKIVSDVSRVIRVYDSGEVYYTKSASAEKRLIDYVDDDLAASDASLTEPASPNYPASPEYPYWGYYDTMEAYEAALAQYERDYAEYQSTYNRMQEEYYQAYEAYRAKLSRDSLRENLKNATMDAMEYTLYYYDGKDSTVVTDALADEWDIESASDRPVAVLRIYNKSDMKKVKLSETSYLEEVRDLVNTALYSSAERHVAVGASLSEIEQTKATNYMLSSDGSTVYFLDDLTDDGYGDLYKVTIKDGQAGTPELFDSDVRSGFMYFAADNELAYYKNVDTGAWKGDLYLNGTEIDYDVRLYSSSKQNGTVLYFIDWSNDHSYGTLKMFKDGTKTKIADDVHDFAFTGNGDILYLYDYSSNYYTGTLYSYNKGKPEKIDDDVVTLIPVADWSSMRGSYYYGW